LTAGLIVALLAGFVGYAALQRATGAQSQQSTAMPQVPVVVAQRAVTVRSQLKAEDLAVHNVPVDAAPEGALSEVAQVAGQVTLVDLYPGETILKQRLLDPNVTTGDGRLALVMAQDQVLMALPAADLMTKAKVLKPGDHVDLLFSLKFPANQTTSAAGGTNQEKLVTFDTLQNATISAFVAGNTQSGGGTQAGVPDGIILTVAPQDALVLKYVKDAGATIDIVLRAPNAEQPYTVDPVDTDYLIRRYQIPVQVGR
jgi:pilus assembly protein CpaB